MSEAIDPHALQIADAPLANNVSTINITNIIGLLFGLAALIVANVAVTLFVLDRYGFLKTPEIVSLNAADMVLGFVQAQGADVSQAELERRIKLLNANLDGAVSAFATERGVIVVNSAAVLGGTRDVTGDMLNALGLVQ